MYAALPWDYISQEEFSKMPDERKLMSYAFYDIENEVFSSILQHGFDLLSEDGKIFVTSADVIMRRIRDLCNKYDRSYKIVAQGKHTNGNTHYILEILPE